MPAVVIGGSTTLIPGSTPLTVNGKVISVPTLAPGESPSQAIVVVDGTTLPLTQLGGYLATAAPGVGSVRATTLGMSSAMGGLASLIMEGLGASVTGAGSGGVTTRTGLGASNGTAGRTASETASRTTAAGSSAGGSGTQRGASAFPTTGGAERNGMSGMALLVGLGLLALFVV